MAFPWVSLAILGALAASPLWVSGPPSPQPLPAVPPVVPAPLPAATMAAAGHPLVLGDEVLFRTSQGDAIAVLFPAEAPRYVRHFLEGVGWDTFQHEHVQPLGGALQIGVDEQPYGGLHTFRPLPRSGETNPLPKVPGALVMDRRNLDEEDGGFSRNTYSVITTAGGYAPGEVIGQVVVGLDVLARLGDRDSIDTAFVLQPPSTLAGTGL